MHEKTADMNKNNRKHTAAAPFKQIGDSKNSFKRKLIVPLALILGISGYTIGTRTVEQLIDRSGVYKFDTQQKKARIILPSTAEWRQNYQKISEIAKPAMEAFNLKNPRVIQAIEDAQIVVTLNGAAGSEGRMGLHSARKGKIFLYEPLSKEEAEETVRHEVLHILLLKYATDDEKKVISEKLNEMYSWFPEKFGQYMQEECIRTGSTRTAYRALQKKFKLSDSEATELKRIIKFWLTIYSVAQKHPSALSRLGSAAISELFALFGENKIPETAKEAFVGISSEEALKNVEPISQEAIARAQFIYKSKIETYLRTMARDASHILLMENATLRKSLSSNGQRKNWGLGSDKIKAKMQR